MRLLVGRNYRHPGYGSITVHRPGCEHITSIPDGVLVETTPTLLNRSHAERYLNEKYGEIAEPIWVDCTEGLD